MRVLLINGSPHAKGCTDLALREIAKIIEAAGIETQIYHIGNKPVRGCAACFACRKNSLGRCVFDDDVANELGGLMETADGIVIGSPVYFAGPNGALCALLDRAFFSHRITGKPGAAVVSCRRGGASAAFDRLNKYFTIAQMPIVSSQYWNSIHGNTPEEAAQDLEGLQTMRVLGRNMVRLLKGESAGADADQEEHIHTNFIR